MTGEGSNSQEQRWSFLAPWCQVLQHNIYYDPLKCEGVTRDVEERCTSKSVHLQVALPKRNDYMRPQNQHEPTYQSELVKIREALAILAAVAHVDPSGWKQLLMTQCQVNWWKHGQENLPAHLPARFVLTLADNVKAGNDVTTFCGVEHRDRPSAEYVSTMERIAAVGGQLNPESVGVDVIVPLRIVFGASEGDVFAEGHQDAIVKGMMGVCRAEKKIRQQWERYEQSPVQRGAIRCTFALEPMVADLKYVHSIAKTAGVMERLILNNVWLSVVSLGAKLSSESDEPNPLIAFRQLMIAVFDGERRKMQLANSKYRSSVGALKPLQLSSLVLNNNIALNALETEALFTAMVLNQTTQKLSIHLMDHEQENTNLMWKWLAYGCFSKRARTHCALQSLELNSIGSISVADVEAFLSVVDLDSPEEELYACPRGVVIGREATLKDGAMVQYDITAEQPRTLTFTSCRFRLQTFSDDGNSEWVNVVVPGFGRCLVRRSDLVFPPPQSTELVRTSLTSLTLKMYETTNSSGLPRLLAAIGSSLHYLTIENPGDIVDTSLILRCCPNLKELSMKGGLVEMKFKFNSDTVSNLAISSLRLDWYNVEALAATLCNANNDLAQCVSELHVRLVTSDKTGNPAFAPDDVRRSLNALLSMLEVNKGIEYLEVDVSSEHDEYLSGFMSHRNEVIGHSLNLQSKLAFLSVLPNQKTLVDPSTKVTKKRCKTSGQRGMLWSMDQKVFSQIFAFAAEPVARRVCFNAH